MSAASSAVFVGFSSIVLLALTAFAAPHSKSSHYWNHVFLIPGLQRERGELQMDSSMVMAISDTCVGPKESKHRL